MKKTYFSALLSIISLFILAFAFVPLLNAQPPMSGGAPPTSGGEQPEVGADTNGLTGWAWSSTIGWLSMSCENTGTCGTSNYGVTAASNGNLSGYAWSPHVGWVSFNNNHVTGCPHGSPCRPQLNRVTGQVTGWARALSATQTQQAGGWGGWIRLGQDSRVGVSVSNVCDWGGYAWGSGPNLDSGIIGWLSFRGPGYGVTGSNNSCMNPESLTLSCTATGTHPNGVFAGDTVTWEAFPQGGYGANSYGYAWSGAVSGNTKVRTATYNTSGNRTASVRVDSGNLNQNATCSVTVGPCYGPDCGCQGNNCGCNGPNCFTTPQPPVVNFYAEPNRVVSGERARLHWSASPATRCQVTPGTSGFSTPGNPTSSPSEGAQTQPITNNPTTFSLTCTNQTPHGSPQTTRTAQVRVANPSLTISAEPDRVRAGGTTTIRWSTTDTEEGDQCTVTGPGLAQTGRSGNATVTIHARSTFALNCTVAGTPIGPETATVNIVPAFEEF